ncbi:MAG: hypothetical protein HXX20_22320 [Chloroflexi bacterium]|nr:hypothetical protein [Chloroflexota bacterium]
MGNWGVGEDQLAEQHPTNVGNLSRPDEREDQLAEQHLSSGLLFILPLLLILI